jgi:hypothetical protein
MSDHIISELGTYQIGRCFYLAWKLNQYQRYPISEGRDRLGREKREQWKILTNSEE